MKKMKLKVSMILMATLFLLSATALAGELNPPGAPSPTMHTLDDIYYKIDSIARGVSFLKTGQSLCYDTSGPITCAGTGQDGDLQKGVEWPNPRFTKNGDGTVTDNHTGLVWIGNANKIGDTMNWENALTYCNSLADDGVNLTDGSVAGDWRLPNIKELQSLIDYAYCNPSLSNTAGTGQWSAGDPFDDIVSGSYWSSTYSLYGSTYSAWYVSMASGATRHNIMNSPYRVWPVRDGNSSGCP